MTTAWGGSVPANILNLVAYTVRVAASEVPYDGYRVVGADGDELLAAVRVFLHQAFGVSCIAVVDRAAGG